MGDRSHWRTRSMEAGGVKRPKRLLAGWIRGILAEAGLLTAGHLGSRLHTHHLEIQKLVTAAVEQVGEDLKSAIHERKLAAQMETRTRRMLASVGKVAADPDDAPPSEDSPENEVPVRMPWEGPPPTPMAGGPARPWEPR